MSRYNKDKLSTGKRWEEERRRLGLSRSQIAEKSGKTVQAIGEYERGVSWPGSEALIGFAALGADIYYILTGQKTTKVAEEKAGYNNKEGALSKEEEAVLAMYRGLDKPGRAHAKAIIDALASKNVKKDKTG